MIDNKIHIKVGILLFRKFLDLELFLMFNNGFTAKFEFKDKVDLAAIGRVISE